MLKQSTRAAASGGRNGRAQTNCDSDIKPTAVKTGKGGKMVLLLEYFQELYNLPDFRLLKDCFGTIWALNHALVLSFLLGNYSMCYSLFIHWFLVGLKHMQTSLVAFVYLLNLV